MYSARSIPLLDISTARSASLKSPLRLVSVQVLSLSIDFYIRVFVRVYTSAAETKNAATKLAYVWQSQGCESFTLQRLARKVRRSML